MIIDFIRRDQSVHTLLTIKNECENVASNYIYIYIDVFIVNIDDEIKLQ